MLSLDFADIAIIEIIATARIMAAIVPNSGITTFFHFLFFIVKEI